MIPVVTECDEVLLEQAELDGDLDAEATATELMLARELVQFLLAPLVLIATQYGRQEAIRRPFARQRKPRDEPWPCGPNPRIRATLFAVAGRAHENVLARSLGAA